MSFQTSRKSYNFGLLFKNVEKKKRDFAHRKLSSWSEDHCVMETLESYYPERSKVCFLMNSSIRKSVHHSCLITSIMLCPGSLS